MSERVLWVVCSAPTMRQESSSRMAGLVQGRPWDSLPLCLLVWLKFSPRPRHSAPWPREGFDKAVSSSGIAQLDLLSLRQHLGMNSIPLSCGPANPICTARTDGIAMADDHCSRTAESHIWPCTCDACGPT